MLSVIAVFLPVATYYVPLQTVVPRSSPTKCLTLSGSVLFDILKVFLIIFFEKLIMKKLADNKKVCNYLEHAKR